MNHGDLSPADPWAIAASRFRWRSFPGRNVDVAAMLPTTSPEQWIVLQETRQFRHVTWPRETIGESQTSIHVVIVLWLINSKLVDDILRVMVTASLGSDPQEQERPGPNEPSHCAGAGWGVEFLCTGCVDMLMVQGAALCASILFWIWWLQRWFVTQVGPNRWLHSTMSCWLLVDNASPPIWAQCRDPIWIVEAGETTPRYHWSWADLKQLTRKGDLHGRSSCPELRWT